MRFNPDSHVPLYKQLEHFLISQMRKGVYKHGDPLPSINELDKQLCLGRVTIVQAMRALTEDGFAVARRGKGYYARIRKINELVGVVAPFHPGHIAVYSNLLAGLRYAGVRSTFLSSDEDPSLFQHSVNQFVDYQGLTRLIVVPPWDKDKRVCDSVEDLLVTHRDKQGVEIIVVDREVGAGFLQIHQDRTEGARLLLERAGETGCRKVLVFADIIRRRKKAFSPLLKEGFSGLEVVFKRCEGYARDLRIIKDEKPDVVLANDDIHARMLIKEAGGSVDFRLAGYNGTPSAFSMEPLITTVNSNIAGAGTLAYQHFFEGKYDHSDKLKLGPFLVLGDTF